MVEKWRKAPIHLNSPIYCERERESVKERDRDDIQHVLAETLASLQWINFHVMNLKMIVNWMCYLYLSR